MNNLFFSDGSVLLRTLLIGVIGYVSLVLFLRISGKRTLSKMNAFDLVITVALGSALSNLLLDREVALAEGVLALALLVALQFLITWSSVRVRRIRQVVTGEPSLLLRRGAFIPDALKRERVTEDEVRAAVRAAGVAALADVEAVVLETDGSFSVVRPGRNSGASSLEGVQMATDNGDGR
jgi:uncharacterized membrane protein YcaP (DUF421 family)